MSDFIDNILETSPTRLAELFDVGKAADRWSAEELRDCLEHLLSLPFESALAHLPTELASKLRSLAGRLQVFSAAEKAHIRCFGDLFRQPDPPLDLLRFAKDFGKAVHRHEKIVWPPRVGAVIYYTSLGAALVHCGERIGRLSTEDLRKGFGQMGALPWVDDATKKLFAEARL